MHYKNWVHKISLKFEVSIIFDGKDVAVCSSDLGYSKAVDTRISLIQFSVSQSSDCRGLEMQFCLSVSLPSSSHATPQTIIFIFSPSTPLVSPWSYVGCWWYFVTVCNIESCNIDHGGVLATKVMQDVGEGLHCLHLRRLIGNNCSPRWLTAVYCLQCEISIKGTQSSA